jgi:preprotein translocase subunit SecG
MRTVIEVALVVVSVLLTTAVLMQKRGTGLGGVFGGEGSVYLTKRGAEKVIYIATIILAVAFVALSLAELLLLKKA